MRIPLYLLLFVITGGNISAQQNRIKTGIIAVPLASGFGMGSLGYERLNKQENGSWQFFINGSFGEIGNDAGAENRIWGTVEKTFYNKAAGTRMTWSYSLFLESGTRVKKAGMVDPSPSKTFRESKWFEVNPGVALGLQYRLGRRWRLEGVIGPKLIIAGGKDYYYNSITNQVFTEPANQTIAGYRVMGFISYQF